MKVSRKVIFMTSILIVFATIFWLGRSYNLFTRQEASDYNETDNSAQGETETDTETEAEKIARQAAEAEAKRIEEERLEREKAEEEARIAKDIAENSWYIISDETPIYDQIASDDKTPLASLEAKTKVYVSEYIKQSQLQSEVGQETSGEEMVSESDGDDVEDSADPIVWAQIKSSYDAVSPIGYVAYDQLVKSRSSFVTRPYEDADYDAFEKTTDFEENPPIHVKGIYVTGPSISTSKIDDLIALIEETELNAMVIDVKDDNGHLLFYSETAAELNPSANNHIYIDDMAELMAKLKAKNIYLIARIVTFKSPIYAKSNPDKAITYKSSGGLYSDADGLIWASAYNEELWQYNVGVAKEAAAWGFNEIQFDYVRFPAIGNKDQMDFKNETGLSQAATIQSFLKYAYGELNPMDVYIAADVFGWAATAINDVGIGQHWEAVSNVVDYICPMVYPSHYGPYNYGIPVPDAQPYNTIDATIKDAIMRNTNIETPAKLRPWIQDFTASWVEGHIRYGDAEVKAQIEALEANGVEDYLLWNSRNNYSQGALIEE